MDRLIKKYLTPALATKLLPAASVGALTFALIMQYGFDVHPCVLCLWQRAPFVLTAILAATLWAPALSIHRGKLLAACAVIYTIGAGLAVFHSGVELHWWVGTSGCAIQPLHGSSSEDLRAALLRTVAPRCDEVAWTVFGLSMANLNIAYSLALAIYATLAAYQTKSA